MSFMTTSFTDASKRKAGLSAVQFECTVPASNFIPSDSTLQDLHMYFNLELPTQARVRNWTDDGDHNTTVNTISTPARSARAPAQSNLNSVPYPYQSDCNHSSSCHPYPTCPVHQRLTPTLGMSPPMFFLGNVISLILRLVSMKSLDSARSCLPRMSSFAQTHPLLLTLSPIKSCYGPLSHRAKLNTLVKMISRLSIVL